MPSILNSESWRIIMNALHRIERFLQLHLDKTKSKSSDRPDFVQIRMKINENAMNNPMVSDKYKEEADKHKNMYSLPSNEIIRSLNPSIKTKLESNQFNSKNSNSTGTIFTKSNYKMTMAEEMSEIYPDLQILQSALDTLFSSTLIHEDKVLIEFLKGLGKLTINMLEENGATKAIIPSRKKETAVFGIVRILEVSLINMTRIDIIWDTVVMNELALISSCKHKWLTGIAMEAI
jgi:hypothetical protein